MIRSGHQTMIGVKDQEWFAAKFRREISCREATPESQAATVLSLPDWLIWAPTAPQIQLADLRQDVHFRRHPAKIVVQKQAGLVVKMDEAIISRSHVSAFQRFQSVEKEIIGRRVDRAINPRQPVPGLST